MNSFSIVVDMRGKYNASNIDDRRAVSACFSKLCWLQEPTQ